MTAAVVSDVVPGEAIAAAYLGCVVEKSADPATALLRLAEAVEPNEPFGAEMLREYAAGIEAGEMS